MMGNQDSKCSLYAEDESSLHGQFWLPFYEVLNVVVVGLSVDMQKSDPNNPVWQAFLYPAFILKRKIALCSGEEM